VDGKGMVAADGLEFPHGANDLEIDYTALSLAIPERVRFRYKLEGKDIHWHEAGARRQAFYNGLPPKQYRFRVIACNNEGVWNEAGAAWSFSILPAFYQRMWFQLACASAGLSLVWLIYQRRVRQVTRQVNLRYNERLAERTRIARDLHDTLLQNLAGISLQLDGVSKQVASAPGQATALIQNVRQQVDACFREARMRVWNLRTPILAEQGLIPALREFLARIDPITQAHCELTVSGDPRQFPPEVEEELLHIGQEAINNAIQHAQPRSIRVALEYARRSFSLRISDDGIGFDQEAGRTKSGHWGLKNMMDRATQIRANCRITTSPGKGTEVEVCLAL
jgi:signal transduction histidine kinase